MKTILIFLLVFMSYKDVSAQPGSLDPSYGTNGVTSLEIIPNLKSFAYGVAIQPDGKALIAGSCGGFMVARFNDNGTIDNTFAGKGYDTIPYLGTAEKIIMQLDGKIVAVGHLPTSEENFTTVRYNNDGSRDFTFNSNGIVLTSVSGSGPQYCYSTALQTDGKILTGGDCNIYMGLARYESNGALDNSFNGTGKVLVDQTLTGGIIRKVLVQPDNDILAIGYVDPPANTSFDFVLSRFKPDGSPDNSFGNTGIVLTDFFSGYDAAFDAALLPGGKILVVGNCLQGSNYDIALARYNPDGSLDNSFGTGGKLVIDLGGEDVARCMLIDGQGRIILAGYSDTDCAIVRLHADGSLDAKFGAGGVLRFSVNGSQDRIESMALHPNGKIIAVGWTKVSNSNYKGITARIINEGGVDVPIIEKGSQVEIYPNPATDKLYFRNATDKNITNVEMIAIDGRVIRKFSGSNIREISLQNIPSGRYNLRFVHGGCTIDKPIVIYPNQ